MNYIIAPTGSDIIHSYHKYIKREWKNGHWVYTYDKPSSVSEKGRVKRSKDKKSYDSFNDFLTNKDKDWGKRVDANMRSINSQKLDEYLNTLNEEEKDYIIKKLKQRKNKDNAKLNFLD